MTLNKKIIYSIFFMFLIYLIAQHNLIFMYFDDFGHASLSYGGAVEGVKGHEFSLSQLLEWGRWYYFNWGGRIVYYLMFLLPQLAISIHLFMFIQSLVIFAIIVYMYKLCLYYTKKDSSITSISVLIILYGLIPIEIMRDTVYWASASICYIWSLLPLVMTVYYFMIFSDSNYKMKLTNYVSIVILSFFAASSFEQSGAAILIFLVAYTIYLMFNKSKLNLKLLSVTIISAMVGISVQVFAPGNKIRILVTDSEFANLSLTKKIINGVPNVLDLLFYQKSMWFLILLIVFVTLAYLKITKLAWGKWIIIIINSGIAVFLSKVYLQDVEFSLKIKFVLSMYLVAIIIFYFIMNGQFNMIPYVFMLIASIGCLVLSPNIQNRSIVYFIFILFVVIVVIIDNLLQDHGFKQYLMVSLITLGLFSLINTWTIFDGYYTNVDINRKNDKILENTSYNVGEIEVYKLPNSLYSNEVPYEEKYDVSYIEVWMKEYYNLKPDTKFNWK